MWTIQTSQRLPATLLIMVIISFSCKQPGLSPAGKQTVRDSVYLTLNNYCNAIRDQGLNAEFAYLDSSADFFWVPPGASQALGFDSVAAAIRMNAALFLKVDNHFEQLAIHPLSSSLASYSGRLRSTVTGSNGVATTFTLVETAVMVKRADGWKLFQGQTTIVK